MQLGRADFLAVNRPGDRLDWQIAERVGPEHLRHLGLGLLGDAPTMQKPRGEQLVDRRHVDAVEARRDDRWTGNSHVDFAGPAE